MRKVIVSIDNELMTTGEAAEFLEITKSQVISNLSRNNGSFDYNGFVIKRITPQRHRTGTKIVSASVPHQEWPSISVFCKAFNLKPSQVEAAIKAEQKVLVNGHTYFAPDYKELHRTSNTGRASKLKLDNKIKQDKQSIEVPKQSDVGNMIKEAVEQKVKQLTTEQQCFEMLQKLAIERIKNTEYDKASKVLNALNLLSN